MRPMRPRIVNPKTPKTLHKQKEILKKQFPKKNSKKKIYKKN